jgi:hypothetical protein
MPLKTRPRTMTLRRTPEMNHRWWAALVAGLFPMLYLPILAAPDATSSMTGGPWETSADCRYFLQSNAVVFSSHSNSFSVYLGTDASCSWSASSDSNWLTIQPETGSGSSSISMSMTANLTGSTRVATVSIADTSLTVTQTTSTSLGSVNPSTWSVPANGGTHVVFLSRQAPAPPPQNVTFNSAAWTTSSNQPWLTVTPASGSGGGNITLSAQPTTSVFPRLATALVAGLPVTVSQAGGIPTFSVNTSGWSASGGGGFTDVVVTSSLSDAPWTASTDVDWLSVVPAAGTGSGTVELKALANPYPSLSAARTGRATIAGKTVTVTQGALVETPLGLRVASVNGNQVTLRWRWPGVAPDGYLLYGGLERGQTLATLATGSHAPTFTFEAPTGSFFVRIAGVQNGTPLPPSEDVRLYVNVPQKPSHPEHLRGLANGSDLELSWTNTFSGGAASAVVLDYSGPFSGTVSLGLVERLRVPGVPPGVFTFRVRAVNAQGASTPSAPVTLTFPGACQVPQVPQGLQAYAVGRHLSVLWDPPSAGAAVMGYVLSVGGTYNLALPVSGTAVSSPVPPGPYTFQVRAGNACGTGEASAPVSVVVP